MDAKLYTFNISNPGLAVKGMLERKRIEYDTVGILPGMHPQLIRLRGFSGRTLPAMKLDGRPVQGSRQIARALEELVPDPPLFPADPARRLAVEDAERWGDEYLQMVPRRIVRYGCTRSQKLRRWIAAETVGLPFPGIVAATSIPSARARAKDADASEEHTRREITELPATMARIEKLISDGVIGGEPNAADFQIAGSVRLLLAMEELGPAIDKGPAAEHARRIFPSPFRAEPLPWVLSESWLEPLR